MKKICGDAFLYGSDYIGPKKCWQIAEYIIEQLGRRKRNLDIRLLIHGFRDYLQWRSGDSLIHWKALIRGRMSEKVVSGYVSRAEQKSKETKIALEIHAKRTLSLTDKIGMWKKKTGLSQAAYYKALKRSA